LSLIIDLLPALQPNHHVKSRLSSWLILLAGLSWGTGLLPAQEVKAVTMTPAETAWLAAHPHIRVGFDPAWPPFSLRGHNGEFSGMDADVLDLLSRRLGVKFEPGSAADWTQVYADAVQGRLDLLVGTARTPERERHFHFTSAYIEFPVGIITRNDGAFFWSDYDLLGRTVAGPRNYATMSELAREYPDVKLLYTDDMGQALEQVTNGKADAVITNLANASFLIKTRGLTNLKIGGIMPQRFELRYAVRQDWPELIAILDKGIASLTRADLQALNHRWIRVDYAKVIRWDLVWKTAAAVLAVLGTVIGFLVWHQRSLRRELAKRLLVQHALEKANAELHIRHEEKSELMHVAAHDLRGPLTSLTLGAELLQEKLAGEARQQAEGMISSARQMTHLIDDLLEVHELEEGRRRFVPAPTDSRAMLRQALLGLEPVARRKRISFDAHGLGEGPMVLADAGALREVIDNLLTNALKFSPPGSCVSVIVGNRPGCVRIDIADQGPGVPDTERERIFTKYARGTAKPTAGETSTGLGLAIVRELISAMNGRVWCEALPAGGANFVIEVPLAQVGTK